MRELHHIIADAVGEADMPPEMEPRKLIGPIEADPAGNTLWPDDLNASWYADTDSGTRPPNVAPARFPINAHLLADDELIQATAAFRTEAFLAQLLAESQEAAGAVDSAPSDSKFFAPRLGVGAVLAADRNDPIRPASTLEVVSPEEFTGIITSLRALESKDRDQYSAARRASELGTAKFNAARIATHYRDTTQLNPYFTERVDEWEADNDPDADTDAEIAVAVAAVAATPVTSKECVIKFRHFYGRDVRKNILLRATICLIETDELVLVGAAVPGPGDLARKSLGRRIAEGRARKGKSASGLAWVHDPFVVDMFMARMVEHFRTCPFDSCVTKSIKAIWDDIVGPDEPENGNYDIGGSG